MAYELGRFSIAQISDYETALEEIKTGRKRTHWMWYIFPQLVELGYSVNAKIYGIRGKAEALAYIEDDFLRQNLIEISNVLLELPYNNPTDIFGFPDDLKLKSCMTLFSEIAPELDIFQKVLDKFFNGNKDKITVNLLKRKLTLDEIFLIEPKQWGLRGDTILWDKIKESFKGEEIPETTEILKTKIYEKYFEFTGHELKFDDEIFYKDSMDNGGMSRGQIMPAWWIEEGIPLIVKNAVRLRGK